MTVISQWSKGSYSDTDLSGLRQDAIKRVQEMQNRARLSVENSNMTMNSPVQDNAVTNTYSANQTQAEDNLVVDQMEQGSNLSHQQTMHNEEFSPVDIEVNTTQEVPTDFISPQENSGGNFNSQGGFINSNQNTNSSLSPTSFLGGLLGQNGSGFSGQTIKDIVEGLKNNFGETVSSTFSSVSSPITSIMDKIGIDGDKLLIMGIILILLNEKGDKTLLLALGYLLIT